MQSTVKSPEEGLLWEWRAFGRIDSALAAKVRQRPVRLAVLNQPEEDVYFVSPTSDQNVKLRNYASGSALKIKLLFATGPDLIELYSESATYLHRFPVSRAEFEEAARLLEVKPREPGHTLERFTQDEFIRALAESSPPVFTVDVNKTRTQYEFGDGWIEMADVFFPRAQVQTISIQSPEVEVVRELLKQFPPGDDLEVMNYVEACRRWS
jgi:hypothetical protein